MNIETLLTATKEFIADKTGYAEHNPRTSRDVAAEALPNTGVYRVVVVGNGREHNEPSLRYADFACVIVRPLSGGDANKSNMEAAIECEALITALDSFSPSRSTVSNKIDGQITRENARVLITMAFRIEYQLN